MSFKLCFQRWESARRFIVISGSKFGFLKRLLADARTSPQAALIQSNLTPLRFLQFVALVLILTATALGTGMKLGWFKATGKKIVVSAAQGNEKLEIELIAVRRFGFEPAAITRSAKGFSLNFANHSNQPVLALSLNRLEGNRPVSKLSEVSLKRGQTYWTKYLDLPPGEYELAEASHPEWRCRITLTPR